MPPSLSHYTYIITLSGRDNKDASASGHFVSKKKAGRNRGYSPLFERIRKSVSASCKDGPRSANSIFTPTPPTQKQYGFIPPRKNRAMRSSRGRAGSKAIPLTSGSVSASTAPISTLRIFSSSCAEIFTVKPPRWIIGRLPLSCGETQQGGTLADAALWPVLTSGQNVSN